MMIRRCIALSAAVLLAAGCGAGNGNGQQDAASTSEDRDDATITVDQDELVEGEVDSREVLLRQVDGSGIEGTVELDAGEGDSIRIRVELEGDASSTHGLQARSGSCDDDPVGPLSSYTLPPVEDGSMETEVSLPSAVVGEGSYSLVVYDGEDVDGDIVACGEVEVE
jgi:hypothetical protein